MGVVISVIEIIVFSYDIVDMFAENFAKLNTAQEPSHNKVDTRADFAWLYNKRA